MCGIAGAWYRRPVNANDVEQVSAMARAVAYRGPDAHGVAQAGACVLASVRLSIVDVAHGAQPYSNRDGRIRVVFNGEIYNHADLRATLNARGYQLHSHADGEVIAHLYEEYGAAAIGMLDGQFAIAIADAADGSLLLARDRTGICPLHWAANQYGVFFCSEIKGLLAIGAASRSANPLALVQMAYFGTVCAPMTAFQGVQALPPAHLMRISENDHGVPQRYWQLAFPRAHEQPPIGEQEACDGVQQRMEAAVASHMQGEFPATCFLSGGIDSAVIGALLSRHAYSANSVRAFCATSDHKKIDEGSAARVTADALGLRFEPVRFTEADISSIFPKLVWHAEVPAISTEAAALFTLAGEVRKHSKVVLTGEGADEAYGGYLALRQSKLLGPLAGPGLSMLRAAVRPLLVRHYGTDCLLPGDIRIDSVREQLGCFPAQAYEWEFYRAACMPVLAPMYRQMLAQDCQWEGFSFDQDAVRGRHWLNRSLYVGYQVMLPNYLLGPHGDRLFAANSVEGRYPFLDRSVIEYAASLPPSLKIRGMREKYILRRAARRWLPEEIAARPKQRFTMPFGTPFTGPGSPAIYQHLLAPGTLHDYGYFDPAAVRRVLDALASPPAVGGARGYLDRLGLGIALTLVASMQLWHYMFIAHAGLPDLHPARHNNDHKVTA